LDRLRWFQTGLLDGNPELKLFGSARRSQRLDMLNFGDACASLSSDFASGQNFNPITETECSNVAKGVLLSGLNAGIQQFMQLASNLINQIAAQQSVANMTNIRELLATPEHEMFAQLGVWWLPAGVQLEGKIYFDEQISHLNSFMTVRIAILAVFLSLLSLCFLWVFEPLVRELDMHVKRVRALLVMVPIEVVMSTASLRKALFSAL